MHIKPFPDAANKHVQQPPFPFTTLTPYSNTIGCSDSDLAVKGLRALPFSLSAMEQKELCSWVWVWVRGSVCVYIWEGLWCVPCGWTTNCCAEQHMAYERWCNREGGGRGNCQWCLSPMLLLWWIVALKLMRLNIIVAHNPWNRRAKSKEIHYSWP